MKDIKIFDGKKLRPEEAEKMAAGVNVYLENQNERDEKRRQDQEKEKARKIAAGEYFERGDKVYDAAFWYTLRDKRDRDFCFEGTVRDIKRYLDCTEEWVVNIYDLQEWLDRENDGMAGYYIDD